MLYRIAYAVAAALLGALIPVFCKAGVKQVPPAVGAWLFSVLLLPVYAAVSAYTGTLSLLLALDARAIMFLLCSGLAAGVMWLCLFRALAGGALNRVAPIVSLSTLLVLSGTVLFFGARMWLWRACFIVLVLIGTVLMESRAQRARSAVWLLFAALAALFLALGDILLSFASLSLPEETILLAQTAVAFVFLTIVTAAGRSFSSLFQTRLSNWCFLLFAALSTGGALLCRHFSALLGEWSELLPITCLILPLTLLLSRVCLRERMPGVATLGLILAVLGNFALLMNF